MEIQIWNAAETLLIELSQAKKSKTVEIKLNSKAVYKNFTVKFVTKKIIEPLNRFLVTVHF